MSTSCLKKQLSRTRGSSILEQTSIGILGDLELVEGDIESKFFILRNRLVYIKDLNHCF